MNMKIVGYYITIVGQIVSLIAFSTLVHVFIERDPAKHAVFFLAGACLAGQLPLLYLLRVQLAATGQTLGEFLKTTVVPLLPWGKRDGQ